MPALVVVLVLSVSLLSRETDGSASDLAVTVNKHSSVCVCVCVCVCVRVCVCARVRAALTFVCLFLRQSGCPPLVAGPEQLDTKQRLPVITPLLPCPFSSLSHPATIQESLARGYWAGNCS